eukprot:1365007-Prymnesium_polylepis.1
MNPSHTDSSRAARRSYRPAHGYTARSESQRGGGRHRFAVSICTSGAHPPPPPRYQNLVALQSTADK